MVTRRQHYYPRSLIKHFADEHGKLHVYIRMANKCRIMSYEKICSGNNTYESNGVVDNILENKLSKFETTIGSILKYILNDWYKPDFTVSEVDMESIYQYLILQSLRTDSGRINFIRMFDNIFSPLPRKTPVELKEIQQSKNHIERFNSIFKKKDYLEKYIESIHIPENMQMHIAYSTENLLTSDNPVIATDEWKQIIFPINPFLCIEFQDINLNPSSNLIVTLTKDKIRYLNEATINTANYYIISNQTFTLSENSYIYNRFNNPEWTFKSPHFQLTEKN